MERPEEPHRDQRHAVADAAGDAAERHGVDGFREGYGRQDGRQAAYPNRGVNPTRSQASLSADLPHDRFSFHDAELNSPLAPN
jgi:hypothetical protein